LGLWMGSMFWALAGAAFVLLGLVVIPDSVRALTATGRGAVLDARGFTYHGYSYVTRVAWDDIASAEFDTSNPRLPAMTFSLRPGANLTWTRRRWLAHLEPPPGPSRFTIPAIVLDQPWSVLALCSGMVETPVDRRAGYLASVGERMLVDPAFPHH
ncbi:MAG: hypothetical protein JWO76_126, partial [Nocardioides sp.]|nr:hypothetical protein [Nocardioides sp.]